MKFSQADVHKALNRRAHFVNAHKDQNNHGNEDSRNTDKASSSAGDAKMIVPVEQHQRDGGAGDGKDGLAPDGHDTYGPDFDGEALEDAQSEHVMNGGDANMLNSSDAQDHAVNKHALNKGHLGHDSHTMSQKEHEALIQEMADNHDGEHSPDSLEHRANAKMKAKLASFKKK